MSNPQSPARPAPEPREFLRAEAAHHWCSRCMFWLTRGMVYPRSPIAQNLPAYTETELDAVRRIDSFEELQ
jgi:hypothetical protein